MDSLTQLALGAAVGEAVAGKKAGNKAILWGGIAGTIPDLDVLAGGFMSTVDGLVYHRGFTHSILFALIMAPILGAFLRDLYKGETSVRRWTALIFLGMTTHALLDCFTTWGTQLLWPFSEIRIAWKSIFVVDPLYTFPLLIGVIVSLFFSRTSTKRRKANYTGLIISSIYLLLTIVLKSQATNAFEEAFITKSIEVERFEAKPAPLNTILWAANAESKSGYYIGYYSLFDANKDVEFDFFPKQHEYLDPYKDVRDIQRLIEITNGWYTVEKAEKGIIFNDLRFGQSAGWEDGTGEFVFSYHIFKNVSGKVIIEERERGFEEGKELLKPLWKRMWGSE